MNDKLKSYFGFAKKSGNLVSGTNTCKAYGIKGKLKLLIIANDISEAGKEKAIKTAKQNEVPYIVYGDSEELSHAVGLAGRSVFGITDQGFAETIKNTIYMEMEVEDKPTEKEVF